MSENKRPLIDRRRVFAGVGTAGALAAVAAVLPTTKTDPTVVTTADALNERGGYRLTEHVRRYYETTRI